MNLKENSCRNHESLHEYKDSNDSASIPDFQYPIVIDYAFYFPARRHFTITLTRWVQQVSKKVA